MVISHNYTLFIAQYFYHFLIDSWRSVCICLAFFFPISISLTVLWQRKRPLLIRITATWKLTPAETLPNCTDVEEGPAMPHVERSMTRVGTILQRSGTGCSNDSTPRWVTSWCSPSGSLLFVVQQLSALHRTAVVLQTSRLTQGLCAFPPI